jgi:hypothetical protein
MDRNDWDYYLQTTSKLDDDRQWQGAVKIGTADFNGDGRDDILLQNTTTGNLMIDLMNGTTATSSVSITVGDPSWHAVSTGKSGGQAEIAWQNNDGTVGIWQMNGTHRSRIGGVILKSRSGLAADFGRSLHLEWAVRSAVPEMMLWEMNGTSLAAQVNLPNVGSWQSVNGHPFAVG